MLRTPLPALNTSSEKQQRQSSAVPSAPAKPRAPTAVTASSSATCRTLIECGAGGPTLRALRSPRTRDVASAGSSLTAVNSPPPANLNGLFRNASGSCSDSVVLSDLYEQSLRHGSLSQSPTRAADRDSGGGDADGGVTPPTSPALAMANSPRASSDSAGGAAAAVTTPTAMAWHTVVPSYQSPLAAAPPPTPPQALSPRPRPPTSPRVAPVSPKTNADGALIAAAAGGQIRCVPPPRLSSASLLEAEASATAASLPDSNASSQLWQLRTPVSPPSTSAITAAPTHGVTSTGPTQAPATTAAVDEEKNSDDTDSSCSDDEEDGDVFPLRGFALYGHKGTALSSAASGTNASPLISFISTELAACSGDNGGGGGGGDGAANTPTAPALPLQPLGVLSPLALSALAATHVVASAPPSAARKRRVFHSVLTPDERRQHGRARRSAQQQQQQQQLWNDSGSPTSSSSVRLWRSLGTNANQGGRAANGASINAAERSWGHSISTASSSFSSSASSSLLEDSVIHTTTVGKNKSGKSKHKTPLRHSSHKPRANPHSSLSQSNSGRYQTLFGVYSPPAARSLSRHSAGSGSGLGLGGSWGGRQNMHQDNNGNVSPLVPMGRQWRRHQSSTREESSQ